MLQVSAQLLERYVEPALELEALLDLGEAVQVRVLDGLVDFELVLDGAAVLEGVGLEHQGLGIVEGGDPLDDLTGLGLDDLLTAVLVPDYLHVHG